MSPQSCARRTISLFVAVSLIAAGALATAASAQAATRTKTVPAEFVVLNGNRPGDPGNCSAIGFVKWADDPKAIGWTVNYTFKGSPASRVVEPPFDDVYEWVATYTVPAGFHWSAISKSWADGPRPNDCSATVPRIQALYAGPASVELTYDTTKCDRATADQRKARSTVTRAQQQLRRAARGKAKRSAQAKLKRARAQLRKAQGAVRAEC